MRRHSHALGLLASLALFAPAAAQAQGDTSGVDLANLKSATRIERRLRHAVKHDVDLTGIVRNGTVHHDSFTVAAGDTVDGNILVVDGAATVNGTLTGNLVTLDGDVTVGEGGLVAGDVLALNGDVDNEGGQIGGTVRTFGEPLSSHTTAVSRSKFERVMERLAAAVSVFLVLLILGLGLTVIAQPKLTVVADTLSHSFGRSLLVGLLGQGMILPTFCVLIVVLVASIVGILLVPFVVVAYIVLAIFALASGYVAMAYVIGNRYVRRRLPTDSPVPPSSLRAIAIGLALLASPWLVRAVLSCVPILGGLVWAIAFTATWAAVTAGFGAVLLSRGGTRTHFAGRDR